MDSASTSDQIAEEKDSESVTPAPPQAEKTDSQAEITSDGDELEAPQDPQTNAQLIPLQNRPQETQPTNPQTNRGQTSSKAEQSVAADRPKDQKQTEDLHLKQQAMRVGVESAEAKSEVTQAQAAAVKPAPRSNGESVASEPASARSGADAEETSIQVASSDDTEPRSDGQREQADQRSEARIASAADEPAMSSQHSKNEKPTFLNAGREDQVERPDTQARPAEPATSKTQTTSAETIGTIKPDATALGERSASQIGTERSSLQARSEPQSLTTQSVARGVSAVLRQGGGSLTMKLSPASLGEVRIEMNMQAGKVSVQFDVGSVAAYEAIKGQLAELKLSLEQRGMTVERVETHISPALARSAQAESGSNQRSGDPQVHGDGQNRHDASDGQSRGRAGSEHRGGEPFAGADPGNLQLDASGNFETVLNIGLDAVA